MAQLLDEMSSSWLRQRRGRRQKDEVEQQRLKRRVLAVAGTVRGGDPTRSQRSRELVREAIGNKHQKERNVPKRVD